MGGYGFWDLYLFFINISLLVLCGADKTFSIPLWVEKVLIRDLFKKT